MRSAIAIGLCAPLLAAGLTAHTGPTAKQKSQMQYLETYGHEPDGKPPTAAQAQAVVEKYPSVPTMALAEPTTTLPTSHGDDATTRAMQTRSISRDWRPGWLKEIGWHEAVAWRFNAALNHVCCHSLHGYPWIATWASWLWSYDGSQTTNGYPYWSSWSAPGYYTEMEWHDIENFHWGYGPVSGGQSLHLWLVIRADGTADYGFGDG